MVKKVLALITCIIKGWIWRYLDVLDLNFGKPRDYLCFEG